MPKRRAPATSQPVKSPAETVRECADALCRAAEECGHQHDRISHVVGASSIDAELSAAQQVCELSDRTLKTLSEAYKATSAAIHPDGGDAAWWRAANALWLASREFLRRSRGCDVETRNLSKHGPGRLGELQTEYELEASALLGLRHAAEAYRQARRAAV